MENLHRDVTYAQGRNNNIYINKYIVIKESMGKRNSEKNARKINIFNSGFSLW